MTPEWAFQLLWFGAGIGGTGAVWYFLSQRDYHAALWTGFATVVAVVLALTLHIRNDLIKRDQAIARAATSNAPAAPDASQPPTPALDARPKSEPPALSTPPQQVQHAGQRGGALAKPETGRAGAAKRPSSPSHTIPASPTSIQAGRDVIVLPGQSPSHPSAEMPGSLGQDRAPSQLQSAVTKVLRFPDAVQDSATARSMIETLLADQTPRKLFDVLVQHDEGDIAEIPQTGAALQEFLHKYYHFSTDATKFEDELLNRIGRTVRVRFRQAWAIYLKYAVLRFSGMAKEEVIAGGDFLNFDITWDDAERVFRELSADQTISRRFAELFATHKSFSATISRLKASG